MALIVKNQVIKNPDGKIKYWKSPEGGQEHYHLGVWIDGSEEELNAIERVEYLLDQTFKRPLRSSQKRDNKFGITFWTWGSFNIRVTVFLNSGEQQTINYFLIYKLPDDDGTNYALIES